MCLSSSDLRNFLKGGRGEIFCLGKAERQAQGGESKADNNNNYGFKLALKKKLFYY